MKKILFSVTFLVVTFYAASQITAADCSNAVNICQNASFAIDPNGSGAVQELLGNTLSNPSINPGSLNSGCLLSGEVNPTWMVINIAGSGTLEFSFGQDLSTGCLDWAMWPYNSNACAQISSNQLAPIRCNWNGLCEGFTGIATPLPVGGDASNFEPQVNVTAGQQYLICLSNYSSQTTTVPLSFFGTANVSCNAVLPVTVNNASICPGQTATLTATVTGATSYLWSPSGQTTATITVTPASTTAYTCTVNGVTPNGGTSTGSASGIVTVLPSNDPLCSCTVTASNNGPVCVGAAFNLNATNVSGGSFSWTLLGNSIGSLQNLTGVPAANVGSFPIIVTATDGTGHICTSTTIVVINPLPLVSAGSDVSVCLGNSLTLSGQGANSYQWSGGIQNGVPFTPSSTAIYSVIGTDQNGCVNSDDVTVGLLFAQMPSISPSVSFGCIPSAVVFTNNDPLALNCQWNFGNGTSDVGCGNQTATYTQAGCFDVTITQTDNQGCDTTVTFNDIVCTEDVHAEFYANPGTIGPGNSTVNFYNASSGAINYFWDFGDGATSTAFEPSHIYETNLETGFTTTLFAASQGGCLDSTSIAITYEEQLIFYVPNTFTPDSDEHNQIFLPIFTSGFAPDNFEMKIYNRWGELLFESHDHSKGWNGSYGYNGGVVQAGLYTWVIHYKPKNTDEKLIVKGFVNVLR